jgi:hypothetical protein
MKSILLLIALVLAAVYPAEAQQLKIPRIGIVFGVVAPLLRRAWWRFVPG